MKIDLKYPDGATPLNPDELAELIPNLSSQKELNEFEQTNILMAIRFSQTNRTLKKDLISVHGLKLLHRKMFDETWKWAGEFRKSDKNIGIHWSQIPENLKNLCDDINFWIKEKTYSMEEIAIRFKYRLVVIHPFANGNGRHSRLACDLLIENHGLKCFTWSSRSDLVSSGQTREEYLKALKEADSTKNLDRLLKFARS